METPALELFLHVRVLIGVILGLSVTRLLNGLARFAEHPRLRIAWWVHVGWVLWALLSLVGFWWWEFRLIHLAEWTFGVYLFFFAYACSYFMVCSLLFPDNLQEYQDFQDYFLSRRRWIFGFMALSCVLDVGDTLLKGRSYFQHLGSPYIAHCVAFFAIAAIGATSRNPRVHAALVATALFLQAGYFFLMYDRIS
ncbi:hypothetical protein [Sandaracinobacteroides hominis]|uniref:hypothetical protein n=1 Tax=Sandaracinobacteroides hominis TaxID=2780086 RepID=UPI0018F73960|nr:hypothetical protein [Sandaracinobacteroides hominis]